ncbi:helix-turn-helix transcriptional regulator [Paraburkholderia sp. BL18I3N2]|uniref:helix-turn-helix transcriptional regulator n=1 Tax=Paraburkholderia sp. BL18I3N2 TaxID=1938799 RepID=UPI0015E640B2|nr:AraC family transcriptional regulator [Paraburkholderia sp. BL18I3N2]
MDDFSDETHVRFFADSLDAQLPACRLERSWRSPNEQLLARADERGTVFISRWRDDGDGVPHAMREGKQTHHIVAINLTFTSVKFVHAGRVLVDGPVVPGAIHVTAPGVAVEASYRLPCDVLHIFVAQGVLCQCYEDSFGKAARGPIELDDPSLRRDATIERLGQLLAGAEFWDRSDRYIFSDSIGRAIVSKLVEQWFSCPATTPQRSFGLPKWRLNRAMAYIDKHLVERIKLNDIAESAGLSRMHFAAQFRLALGVSPHEYVLRRRLELAQSMLLEPGRNTLDIALNCGFNSQTHFISVFSRYLGDTPYRWRRNNRRG